jgi:hypothetical protein
MSAIRAVASYSCDAILCHLAQMSTTETSLLLKTGVSTSLRRLFAFCRLNECNRDVTYLREWPKVFHCRGGAVCALLSASKSSYTDIPLPLSVNPNVGSGPTKPK